MQCWLWSKQVDVILSHHLCASGLCGQHTGSGEDDFLMPDGSIYLGEGTGEGEQPFGFIEAWR